MEQQYCMSWIVWIALICCYSVCVQTAAVCEGYDNEMHVDLDGTGEITGNIPGVSVVSAVTVLNGNQECSRQALFKVQFNRLPQYDGICYNGTYGCKKMLKVEFHFSSTVRNAWMFNIGDSRTNNGWAGDSTTNAYAAEMQCGRGSVNAYENVWDRNEKVKTCTAKGLANYPGACNSSVSQVNVWIANHYMKVINDNGLCEEVCSKCLWGLNGQPDVTGPVNEDIFVALNRVVAGSYRNGYGLCSITMKWVNENHDNYNEVCPGSLGHRTSTPSQTVNTTPAVEQTTTSKVCEGYDNEMHVDLDDTGEITGSISGVSVVSAVTGLIGNQECSRQALFKVQFNRLPQYDGICYNGTYGCKKMLKVEFHFSSTVRNAWMFNIGDSRTNNGWAGDSTTNAYAAEMQCGRGSVNAYENVWDRNEKVKTCTAKGLANYPGACNSSVSQVNVWIANHYMKVINDNGLCEEVCSKCLWGLNGQPDVTGPVNEDIFVALNRVVAGSYRNGYGLCSITMKWVNENHDNYNEVCPGSLGHSTSTPSQTMISTPAVEQTTTSKGPCITSCEGLPTGDYQSCTGCDVYNTCVWGFMYPDRPCPAGLMWDDSFKICNYTSTTCSDGATDKEPNAGSCITSCDDLKDGNYQSCTGCDVYNTCWSGFIYADRPCPAGLFWDDNLKACDYSSSTC